MPGLACGDIPVAGGLQQRDEIPLKIGNGPPDPVFVDGTRLDLTVQEREPVQDPLVEIGKRVPVLHGEPDSIQAGDAAPVR